MKGTGAWSLFARRPRVWDNADLIREELFSPERLKQHAHTLAAAQPVSARRQGGSDLSRRLRDDAAVLLRCYREIGDAAQNGTITPSAEWILDNYHIVEEQVFDIRGDLPPGYYRELPKLTAGPFAGFPRVFGIAWAYVAHTDSRFDADLLCGFVDAYQQVQPLTIGELWAIPITLRFVLVENLRRAAVRIVASHSVRAEADMYADRILGLGDTPPQPIAAVLEGRARPYPTTLVVQLAHRLRDPSPTVEPALRWLEQQIVAEGKSIDAEVQSEHTRQAAMNVTVRNIITSMRQISAVDWPDLFERISRVDAMLRERTGFAAMDFPTRDNYRKRIEKLARRSPLDELAVTDRVIELAAAAAARGDEPRKHDPGYFLLSAGQRELEKSVRFRPSLRDRGRRLSRHLGVGGYVGVCVGLAVLVLVGILALLSSRIDRLSPFFLVIIGLVAILPAVDFAATLISRFILAIARPVALPALDLTNGVPPDLRTMIVVPTLLSGPASVDEAIERLEIHYLSNASEDLTLALLSDWNDAPSETMPTDEPILRHAAEGIARLNRSHPRADGDRFLLLHRRRLWSDTQDCWLGWERKRGKLQELNRLLRGATDTTFIAIDGVPPQVPDNVRFVITLDSDSRLPRDSVRRLVGKMAHVINQPRFDPARKRVVEGYGILQPRVTLALPHGSEGSWFQRVFSGARGMDPYASPVSDVYQDLFGEGTFLGKGIYDVDAFEAAMEGRSPENAILSHDLFEGIFARAGLAGDVEVVEAFPRRYDVATSRQHRWARGDWQLLGWLVEGKRLPGTGDPATLLGRWKMLDNLRRTLSAPVTVVALFLGWLLPPAACLIWTAFVLVALAAPAILPVILGAFHVSPRSTWRLHFASVASELGVAVAQTGFVIATLVHQAALMVDAIVRTLWRLWVSRKRLLEWTTAEQAAQKAEMSLAGFYRWMWTSPLLGIAALVLAFGHGDATALMALPFALAWLAAPAIAWRASLVRPNPALAALRPDEAKELRLIARRTWRFFETFVTAEHNWLPPDNFQEGPPQAAVAHRTSPTNMGLYLLATMAAHDFGWLGLGDAVGRLEATFATLRKMFRFRGHFYNWYDTLDLRPLDPQYVSSVDSGNFAGHLIALANASDEIARSNAPSIRRLEGIDDSIALARQSLAERKEPDSATSAALDRLTAGLQQVIRGSAELATLQPLAEAAVAAARAHGGTPDGEDAVVTWTEAALAAVMSHVHDAPADDPGILERLVALSHLAREMAMQMDFRFLMDPDRQLMSIGYVTSESRRDSNCYDLLASEARLASFFAIAKGEVPTKHWFRLGRATTLVEGGAALVSWSGSMFEYLMPSLVMRAPFGSLLESTNRLVVRRQISYGASLGTPWGISESAYNARDFEFTYQYLNFGVPGLGLKRGLSASRVIAPYATALAAMVDPGAAAQNYKALEAAGGRGHFGFYEALDFTPGRIPEGATVAVVRTYMAHHQGMSIIAIANVLLNGVMRRRFHSEAGIAASELLLEERHPQVASAIPVRADELVASAEIRPAVNAPPRQFETAHTARPQSGVLSNTRYSVMVTNSGSGYSHWKNLAVTRWREDASLDDWGSYIYLRDLQDRRVWSAGYQPTCIEPESYSTSFAEDRIRITRRDRTIMTTLEIAVSAEDDAEVRRVSLTNMGGMERQIEVTSFAEMVLGPDADDVAHPAFSKMFVETEFVKEHGTLIGRRRKRDPGEPDIWAGHFAVVEGQAVGEIEVETDRARFIGVGQTLRSPAAMQGDPLSNSVGTVLDPIFSMRRRIVVSPGTTARVSFWTVVGPSRESILDQVIKYDDTAAFERVGTLAWTHAQVQLRHIDLTSAEASIFQRLGTCILFPEPRFRAPEEVLKNPAFELRGLWAQGISGDLPIVVLRLDSVEDIDLARELALAHEYLRLKRLPFDLVIINERGSSYAQDLQQSLEVLGRASETHLHLADEGRAGRIFLLRNDLISAESRLAILLAARVILVGSRGTLSGQLDRFASGFATVPAPRRARRPSASRAAKVDAEFSNEFGGFAEQGREYAITIEGDQRPPAPWINVVANPSFGFHMAADGASYTWSINSRDNQITPWSNDPVVNRSGEAVYIRDDDGGELWGPTAHPWQNPAGTYRAVHGRGYSRFEHSAADIASELTSFVPLDDSIKVMRLKLRNLSERPRRLSVAAYMEWVLATSRGQSAASIVTEMSAGGVLLARNPRNQAYPHRLAFLALCRGRATWTGDRSEFLGRHGSTAEPAALVAGGGLSNRVGAGLDPCGALLTQVTLAPGEEKEVTLFLGDATTADDVDALVEKYRNVDLDSAFTEVKRHWDNVLGAVTVATPDRAMDVMLNGWLLYQTLACRMWARSGFYQTSGAFGFRDQLQDCLALVFAAPNLAREHIVRAAGRQFVEGDMQHWWLPASGQGVRTRIADDPVWLAYAVAEYVSTTGDATILDETVPYLQGPRLAEHEHDAFFAPEVSDRTATIYQHCVEALQQSAATGERGLPLMRGGDWNDGMNRVGIGGKGESVWLAWFRYRTLLDFAAIAERRGDATIAAEWTSQAKALATAVEDNAWDGAWYRRAYFDDGTPLGSSTNQECRIDSIAQSWAVISGAAPAGRASDAVAEVERQLVKPADKLALLFAPPFDEGARDPGYIKGYPPGLRENGGQYTHGAIWLVVAEALQGNGDKAAALFAMLNPINRTLTADDVDRYKVEPYVVVADVYSADGLIGRGGWTWYTGSAGWLYRAGVEWILGLRPAGDSLRIAPSIPRDWPGFRATLRRGAATYHIAVENPQGHAGAATASLTFDGKTLDAAQATIPFVDDGAEHHATLVLARRD